MSDNTLHRLDDRGSSDPEHVRRYDQSIQRSIPFFRRMIARYQQPVEPGPYHRTRLDELEAAERWRRSNAEARAAGCRCGKPGTKVTRYGGTIGGVPHEVWTCDEHEGVQSWSKAGDGPWTPHTDTAR